MNEQNRLTEMQKSAKRMQQSRKQKAPSPLHGLSAFGVIGWSVAVPTVAGALLGGWLNTAYPQKFSWPLVLILGGIVLGVFIAWDWIDKQNSKEQNHD